LESQAQYIAAERSEVWVNIGYRLSAFGFLACDRPKIEGNFGFKDQWVALEWVRDNIAVFGGRLDGLTSAQGSHSPLPLFIWQETQRTFKSQVCQQAGPIPFYRICRIYLDMTC
jgi:carboxylesterase type B